MKINNSNLKIVFLGTPEFVEPVIDALNKNFNLVKIIRNPQQLNQETIQQLKQISPDIFVVAAFGKILTPEILEIPKLGVLNIHPSLLPKLRGSTPIQSAILNGDKKTGITIIKMDEKVDHGPILDQIEEKMLPADTFESLANRLFDKSADLIVSVLMHFENIKPFIQDEKNATYTKILTKDDGFIDPEKFNELKIENLKLKIRAFYPWPGVWTQFRLSSDGQAKIVKILPDRRIQVEGKKPMSYKDFMNGYENGKDFLQKLSLI